MPVKWGTSQISYTIRTSMWLRIVDAVKIISIRLGVSKMCPCISHKRWLSSLIQVTLNVSVLFNAALSSYCPCDYLFILLVLKLFSFFFTHIFLCFMPCTHEITFSELYQFKYFWIWNFLCNTLLCGLSDLNFKWCVIYANVFHS